MTTEIDKDGLAWETPPSKRDRYPHRWPWRNTPHFYALMFGRAAIRRMVSDFAPGAEDRIANAAAMAAGFARAVLARQDELDRH